MKNDCENVFLYIKDTGFKCVKNESETFLKNFHMNDELFNEAENSFSECYNDIINISCIRI